MLTTTLLRPESLLFLAWLITLILASALASRVLLPGDKAAFDGKWLTQVPDRHWRSDMGRGLQTEHARDLLDACAAEYRSLFADSVRRIRGER
jgi:hypothetical protein